MSAVDPSEKLVRMANQIAAFFRSYPQDEAVAGIHKHIVAFWTPRMRTQLTEYIEGGAEDLNPLVTAAIAPKAKVKS